MLRRKGMQIVERNYRCPFGEVDIIARDGVKWVFVEVKRRSTLKYGTPAESVTRAKQRKIVRTAQYYWLTHKLADPSVRFDVVTIFQDEMNHIENAFDAW
jgi:putative endonuclease